jgi:hypothetical protein
MSVTVEDSSTQVATATATGANDNVCSTSNSNILGDGTSNNGSFPSTSMRRDTISTGAEVVVVDASPHAGEDPTQIPPIGEVPKSHSTTPQGEVDGDGDGDADGNASEPQAVCALHNKKRRISFLQQLPDGTYTCAAPNLCKMPRASTTPVKSAEKHQEHAVVMCSIHGKHRSARNMVRISEHEYRCHPSMQCRLERGGPGRSLDANHVPHPYSLSRNQSSNLSVISDLSVDSYGGSHHTSPSMQGLQQPRPQTIYYMGSAPTPPMAHIPQQQGMAPFVTLASAGPNGMMVGAPMPMAQAAQPGQYSPVAHLPSNSQPQYILIQQPGTPQQHQTQPTQAMMGSPQQVMLVQSPPQPSPVNTQPQPVFVQAGSPPMYIQSSPQQQPPPFYQQGPPQYVTSPNGQPAPVIIPQHNMYSQPQQHHQFSSGPQPQQQGQYVQYVYAQPPPGTAPGHY